MPAKNLMEDINTLFTASSNIFETEFKAAQSHMYFSNCIKEVPIKTDLISYTFSDFIGGLEEIAPDQPIRFDSVVTKNFVVGTRDFANGIKVHIKDIENNNFSIYQEKAASLAYDAASLKDNLVADVLNGESAALCYDGATLFGDHTIGASTINNLMNLELTAANLDAAITRMQSMKLRPTKGARKIELNRGIDKLELHVPVSLRAKAEDILTVKILANGAENRLFNRCNLVVNGKLEDNGAWFLANTSGRLKPFIYQNRKPAKLYKTDPMQAMNFDPQFLLRQLTWSVHASGEILPTMPWYILKSKPA